jgi:hypothetical protein
MVPVLRAVAKHNSWAKAKEERERRRMVESSEEARNRQRVLKDNNIYTAV